MQAHLRATQEIVRHWQSALPENRACIAERVAMMVHHYVHISHFLPKNKIPEFNRLLHRMVPFRLSFLLNNKAPIVLGAYIHLRLGMAAYDILTRLRH